MHTHRSSGLAPGGTTPLARFEAARNPVLMEDDPCLPRVGEVVALHRPGGPRLWAGRVRSAYDGAVSVVFDAVASRPTEPHTPEPGEEVELAGLAGTPIDARGTVRGHKDGILLLRDVTPGEGQPEQAQVSIRAHGRLWCEDTAGTGCLVEVFDRFPDGLCISAPAWVHPGDAVGIGFTGAGAPVPALAVACREARHRRTVAHVAFLAGPSDPRLDTLLAGLADES
jgi:hypothetical protein